MLTVEQIHNPESLYYKACVVIENFKFKIDYPTLVKELEKQGLDVSDTNQIYHAMDWAHQWTSKPLY